MRALRNVLVIAALAAVVAFAPAGSNAFDALMVTLTIAFLSVIAWAVWGFVSRNELTLDVMTDRDRALLYGAAGTLVLLLAGTDRFFASGPGTVVWIALLIGAIVTAWRTWQSASQY